MTLLSGKVKRRDLETIKKYESKLVAIAKKMNVPDDVIEHAKSLLHLVFLFYFDFVVTRLRPQPLMVLGAILELASNDLGFYFSTKAFCRRFDVNGGKLRKLVEVLSSILGIPKDFDIDRAIRYYALKLDLSLEDEHKIREIYDRIDKEGHEYKRLLIALTVFLIKEREMTTREIANVLNVTTRSIQRYVKIAKTIYGFEI